MKEINNIADTTGQASYEYSPTPVAPDMEQLYFELEDKDHVFQVGIKNVLECIFFAIKESQLPMFPIAWYNEVCTRYNIPFSEMFGDD